MSLAAYSYAAPLHPAALRINEDPGVALEGLKGATLANATRYAKEAAARALAALLAGDVATARAQLRRAQGWDAYALTLNPC